MSVHQPQAYAAYNRETVSTIERLESDFLRLNAVYPEDEMSVADRWFRILEYLPDVRGRHLYEDLTAVYANIYNNVAGSRVSACIDFLLIRQRFFMMLNDTGVGRTHQNLYEIDVCVLWRDRLIDRMDDVDPAKIKRGKYIPAKAAAPTSHKWIQ